MEYNNTHIKIKRPDVDILYDCTNLWKKLNFRKLLYHHWTFSPAPFFLTLKLLLTPMSSSKSWVTLSIFWVMLSESEASGAFPLVSTEVEMKSAAIKDLCLNSKYALTWYPMLEYAITYSNAEKKLNAEKTWKLPMNHTNYVLVFFSLIHRDLVFGIERLCNSRWGWVVPFWTIHNPHHPFWVENVLT